MNANLLRAAMAEKGMNQTELAKAIGISANSMSRKLNGRRDFTISEAAAIASALNLKAPQHIFFVQFVPYMQRLTAHRPPKRP